jgi:hypothetical protein
MEIKQSYVIRPAAAQPNQHQAPNEKASQTGALHEEPPEPPFWIRGFI